MSLTLNVRDKDGNLNRTSYPSGTGLSVYGKATIGGFPNVGKTVLVVGSGGLNVRQTLNTNLWGDYAGYIELPAGSGSGKITVSCDTVLGLDTQTLNIAWGGARTPPQETQEGSGNPIGTVTEGIQSAASLVKFLTVAAVLAGVGYLAWMIYKAIGK